MGLESTRARISDLLDLYISDGDIKLSSWRDIVLGEDGWNLKTENIADVFYSLKFVQKTSGDLLILENLDALAIADQLLPNGEETQAALSFIFLWSIVVNDGELFMNMLLADFDRDRIREKLGKLITTKRRTLSEILPGKDAQHRVADVVIIERQEKNKGSAGDGQSVAALNRTEPLQKSLSKRSSEPTHYELDLSNDYFRKVPPRRKDWARTLGLWSDEVGLTSSGASFVASLRNSGYIDEAGVFTFWPMDYELVRSGFRADLLPKGKSLWQTLVDFASAYAGIDVKAFDNSDADKFVDQLAEMTAVYRSLHTRKSMLRRELPITVAYPAMVAIACARKQAVISAPSAIEFEQKGQRRITYRSSRYTGGALGVKR